MPSLATKLTEVHGVPPRFIPKLKRLGLETVRDLLWHFPVRYEDFSKVYPIADLIPNQEATVTARVTKIMGRRTWHRTFHMVEATLADDTGEIRATWFNQPYIQNVLQLGRLANFSGKVTVSKKTGDIYLSNPTYELLTTDNLQQTTKHTARIVPIYRETKGLTSKGIRYLMEPILRNLPAVPDILPPETLRKHLLPDIHTALRTVHFPDTLDEALAAKRRFAFEDLFLLQLVNLRARAARGGERAVAIPPEPERMKTRLATLPFTLTASQKRSLWEILQDLECPHPMNRLLQGDVGSGKTIVVGLAAIHAAESGVQVAIMAPTELLARQHYRTLTKVFHGFELGIALRTASESRAWYGHGMESEPAKAALHRDIARGSIAIVIGTQALITNNKQQTTNNGKQGQTTNGQIQFKNLGLVIVDEQHRFGVEQRAALLINNKQQTINGSTGSPSRAQSRDDKQIPHFLSMSATPIPRTLSLTIFGDLDVSLITELPKDRKPIVTKAVGVAERSDMYAFMKREIAAGRQAFVVCPRIDPPGEDPEPLTWEERVKLEVKSATAEYEKLKTKVFPKLAIGMLHGRLKAAEKERVMSAFASPLSLRASADKRIDILVTTSVVEVGVDVPNATVMLIEGAERFGLAQLYQFRGRVGRGEHQSYCFLVSDSTSSIARARLKAVVTAKNGFELAEHDLKLRGPGEFLGSGQSGFPDLAMQAIQNPDLVKAAREAAQSVLRDGMAPPSRYGALRERLVEFERKVHWE
ncbi:MAG: ATP-dependent DNA helicase RecG [bacterium]|nr:ATP-dependent DNA helicase RecG [bacterium]